MCLSPCRVCFFARDRLTTDVVHSIERTMKTSHVSVTIQVGFSRGAGSQLMLSAMSTRSQYDILEEQARVLLNTEEQATLRYYLAEYSRDVIKVPGFVSALVELLNTGAKVGRVRVWLAE